MLLRPTHTFLLYGRDPLLTNNYAVHNLIKVINVMERAMITSLNDIETAIKSKLLLVINAIMHLLTYSMEHSPS